MKTLALVVACAAVLAASASAVEPPNAADLEAELVCPVCETTLDQSNAPVAQRMKLFIRERIAAGDSEQEIKDALVAEFGPGVLATPRKSGFGLIAWRRESLRAEATFDTPLSRESVFLLWKLFQMPIPSVTLLIGASSSSQTVRLG